MNKLLSLFLVAAAAASLGGFSHSSLAQAQLSRTSDELREFLYPRPITVNINGEDELTAYRDTAKVSLMVTSDERSPNRAMRVNQALRQTNTTRWTSRAPPSRTVRKTTSRTKLER
jgi:uncharacterized protein YggE